MGLKIKDGFSYEDKYGNIYTEAYARVLICNLGDKKCRFDLAIYKDKAARDADALPVGDRVFVVIEPEYSQFFNNGIFEEAGKTPKSQSYEYIKQHKIIIGQEEQEVEVDGETEMTLVDVTELEFKNWEDYQE